MQEEVVVTGMAKFISLFTDCLGIFKTILDWCLDNPVVLIGVVFSIIGLCIYKIKSSIV